MDGKSSNDNGLRVIRVAVGSGNPCKIDSVKQAIFRIIRQNMPKSHEEEQKLFEIQVEGFDVESGVAAQPMGDDETQTGAKNRAKGAYKSYQDKFLKDPHLAVGLEGGLEWSSDEKILWCMAWMCCYGLRTADIVDLLRSPDTKRCNNDDEKNPIFGLAKTAAFPIPPPVTRLVKQGLELGDADDKVFNRVKSKQGSGTVGFLSNFIINRADYYEHALILALIPWIRPDVYPDGCESQTQENGK